MIALNFVGGLRYNVNNRFHYADSLTFIRGRHMMKTGGQFLRQQANVFYAGNNGRIGFMRFTGQYTAGPNASRPVSKGLTEADFVLGYPTSLGRGIAAGLWGQRKSVVGAYFQDDWRVTGSLTLNLGIRWEYHSPYVEVADRQPNFEVFTGRFLQAGKDGVPRKLYDSYTRAWQPRVGLAWTPEFLGKKTVLRAAYTISSYLEGMGVGERLTLNPPYATEYAAIYDGFANVGSTVSQGFSVLRATDLFKGASNKMWDQRFRPSDVQQWSFVAERQLPIDTLVSAGYIGQHGTHLCGRPYYGQKRLLPDRTVALSPYIAGNPSLLLAANVRGTSSDYSQQHHSLQTSLRKKFSRGLEYQVSYTWSKGMSDSIGFYGERGQAAAQNAHSQNVYDRRAEWGPTYFDAAHIFTFHGAYDLPLGRGMAFGSGWRPVLNGIAGNWRLSGMLTLRTGFPLTITALDRSGPVSGRPRPDPIADGRGSREVGAGASWFDESAFRQPVAGTFGTSGVGVVRGPGLRNLDVSLQKSFPVRESKRFEFRAEFFNLSNTPIFNAPDRAVNSATFGEVTAAQGERNIQLALKFHF